MKKLIAIIDSKGKTPEQIFEEYRKALKKHENFKKNEGSEAKHDIIHHNEKSNSKR